MAELIAVPGVSTLSSRERRRLVEIAQRNGWRPDWLAATLSHESHFKPGIQSATSSATGILQWTKATAKALGTSTDELRRMSVYEQLPYVEKYFHKAAGGRRIDDRDLLVWAMGAGNCPGLEDDCQLYPPGSLGAKANPSYQDSRGAITVKRVRDELSNYVAKYEKRGRGKPALPAPRGLSRPTALGSAAFLGLAGLAFVWGTLRIRPRRRPA